MKRKKKERGIKKQKELKNENLNLEEKKEE